MDWLHILVVLLGVVSSSHDWISGSQLDVTVRPGDNITLHCDCKQSLGVYIVWFRNCSHGNQPTLVMHTVTDKSRTLNSIDGLMPFPRYEFLKNDSSHTYDLLILNVTDSDEGFYYCATEQMKLVDDKHITRKSIYNYGNITTKLICDSIHTHHHEVQPVCDLSWMQLYILCPVVAAVSSLLSSFVVYQCCHKKATEPQVTQQRPDNRNQTTPNQDEDVCYAALEIRQASQRAKKTGQSYESSTYSTIKTSRV